MGSTLQGSGSRRRVAVLPVRMTVAVLSLSAALSLASPAGASPLVVDRIVAVVDTSPILKSEVTARMRPFKRALEQSPTPKEQIPAREAEIEKELLTKMIE